MILKALESIYETVRRLQLNDPHGNVRMNPAFSLILIITPVNYALLVLAVGNAGFLSEPISPSFYRSTSMLFWLAALISTLVVVMGFDRRRAQIESTFSSLPTLATTKHKVLALFGMIFLVISLAALSSRFPVFCIVVFIVVLQVLGHVIKRLPKS